MAGDWIKLEATLPDKPEVSRIAKYLGISRGEALLACVRWWIWADQNTVDGFVDGLEPSDVDEIIAIPRLGAALIEVQWLIFNEKKSRLEIPHFDRHNGETAKKRALKNKRQAKWRSGLVDDPSSTAASTREEKRRSNPIVPSGQFVKFWTAWPKSTRKQSRGSCWERWRKEDLDSVADQIVAHVEAMKLSMDWRKDSGAFIPAPLVYLNQRRWDGADLSASAAEKRMVM